MNILRLLIPLWLLYLVLTANFALNNMVVGLAVAAVVALLLRPKQREVDWRRLPAALWAFGKYLGILVYDLVVSGLQVARIVLTPSLPIRPGIIAIPSNCKSEYATALSAHAITLTPGEMVVEIDEDGVMYTHVLDVEKAQQHVAQAQQMRRDLLQKIFI